ncbi:MAG: hypothetical protein JO129_04015, partial [Candidatus Dependentiae bacterium]|nr:hypothetical protein [Candidatus Dependentiae bacterium]
IDDKILHPGAYQAVCLNRNITRQDITKQFSVEEMNQQLQKCLPLSSEEMKQALKFHYSMSWHKQEPVDYQLYLLDCYHRQKFYESLWPIIKEETRVEQIARLKKENPVDINSQTNKFVNLFDRIAKDKNK